MNALLVKPAPNNPALTSQRREIALLAQELKVFLQVVRRKAYRRLTGRLLAVQMGFLAGYSSADTALAAHLTMQQAARLGHPLWILYIDLATMFPRMDRGVLTFAETIHGLPREVQELVAAVYGGAVAGEADATECQYDSAVGLSEYFRMTTGAFMGCPLSPDRAKLLLNTIVVAIAAYAKGVVAFGETAEEMCHRVMQLLYADDWCGVFGSLEQLRRAWRCWTVWEVASGSRLGIKGHAKTVVSGVWREGGKVRPAADPTGL